MERVPDSELIRRYRDGDLEAFRCLFNRHQAAVLGYLTGMVRDEAAAEDLTQETFLRVVRTLPRYRESDRFASFLFTIAYRIAVDYLRRRRRSPLSDSDSHDPRRETAESSPGTNPEELLYRLELRMAVNRAVDSLPPDQKEVILLRYFSGLTSQEIADILGCSVNTILGRAYYAFKKLRKHLLHKVDQDEL